MAGKSFLDELVQTISVDADTRAYDVIEKKNKQIIQSTNKLGSSFDKTFKKALGYMGAFFGARALVNFADEWKNIDSILKLVSKTDEQRLRLQEQLFGITQRTRQAMAGTVDLYRKITVATEKLGTSESDRLKTTETINKALLIGGGSRASNNAALVQLGQGLAADSLRGQELNSILEQAPRLAQAIADGLGLQVGDLRKYAEKNGGIRSKQVMDAILSQTGKINSEFGNVNMTVARSLTMLNNSFGKLIYGVDTTNGLTDSLAKSISFIAGVLDRSAGIVSVIVKYAKQLLILFFAMKSLNALKGILWLKDFSTYFLGVKNIKDFIFVLGLLKESLLALVGMSWTLLGPWIKLLAVALALKEIIDTLKGKDTFLRDASEALGENYNNRMAKDYEDIFNMFGNGWGGMAAAGVATPALMIKNGTQMGMEKLLTTQTNTNKSVVNNITQNITTSQPQAAANMMLDSIQRYNAGG